MSVFDPANGVPRSFGGDLFYAARYYLGSRGRLVAIAAATFGLGAYYNWAWLVAGGFAPIILAALPCVAMCALGLCMSGRSKVSTNEPASTQSLLDEPGGHATLRLGESPVTPKKGG